MIPDKLIEEKKRQNRENKLDRRKMNEKSLSQLEEDISNIDDPSVQSAIEDLAHILTGDNRFE
jgi:hypothetical protein